MNNEFIIRIQRLRDRNFSVSWKRIVCNCDMDCFDDVMDILESKESLSPRDQNNTFNVSTYSPNNYANQLDTSGKNSFYFRIDTNTCRIIMSTIKKHNFNLRVVESF